MPLEITTANLILFFAATAGLTNLLIYGRILQPMRNFLRAQLPIKIYSLLHCYQCTGFWAGIVAGFLLISHNPFVAFATGCAGSWFAEFIETVKEWLEMNSIPPDEHEHYHDDDDEDFEIGTVKGEQLMSMLKTGNTVVFEPLEHEHAILPSVAGTVHVGNDPSGPRTFTSPKQAPFGKLVFADDGKPPFSGTYDAQTGKISLTVDKDYDEIWVMASYEYIIIDE